MCSCGHKFDLRCFTKKGRRGGEITSGREREGVGEREREGEKGGGIYRERESNYY